MSSPVPGVVLAASCNWSGGCPTVYQEDPETVLVQGYVVDAPGELPAGESLVRIPAALLRQAAQALPS